MLQERYRKDAIGPKGRMGGTGLSGEDAVKTEAG